ncbi:MAG: AAA family ATPase [Candidatus Aenigmarchaeota archaeon]|nr:AAA family ATPase [Candidatus Aenigmarchaeota archaeon]
MTIKRIKISNFKSFKDIEVELGNFNVLIGANASGKSNFIEIFKFLRDITKSGLNNAISMQGGCEYLTNINIGSSKEFSVKIISDQNIKYRSGKTQNRRIGINTYETIYEFALRFKKGLEFQITKDILTQKCKFVRLEEEKHSKNVIRIMEKEEIGKGEIILSRGIDEKVNIEIRPKQLAIYKDVMYPLFLREEKLPPKIILLQTPFFLIPLEMFFSDISVYDFDTKLPKKATPITGKAELEENGSNLSIVLKNIIQDKNKRRKLFNLIQDILPIIDSINVENFSDKSLLFNLKEIYSKKYLPASLISDGTINITALLVALYFEKKPVAIIEEPERNIHPSLISKMTDVMKDASAKKQILVTTHNLEVVKSAGLENLLLVSRNKDGFSTISKPTDKKEIMTFLKNEIGIEELYIQNLL